MIGAPHSPKASETQHLSAQDQIGLRTALFELYPRMSPERRRHFYFVLGLMTLGALVELATIGAVLPFLSLLADPAAIDRVAWVTGALDAVGAATPRDRLLAATVVFIILALIAGVARLQLAWSSKSFVFKLGHELSVEIERRILLQPYGWHISRNTSSLIASLEKVQTLVFSVLLQLMQAMTAIFISTFILAALLYVDPFSALVAAAAFVFTYLIVSAITRRRLARNSAIIGSAYDERVKIVQESLGGIRDVIIDNSQAIYLEAFRQVDQRFSAARTNTSFIAAAPRFVIEALGMVLIASIAVLISDRERGVAGALPILGAMALGAQRLLPLLQQIYHSWTIAAGNRSVIDSVIELLRLPVSPAAADLSPVSPLLLKDRIRLQKVSFFYPGRRAPVVKDVNLEIARGSTVALIGRTGSGKSTLADLLMGLIEPTSGQILVNGVAITEHTRRRWWCSIAHVPQAIFLADTSIARNIAFGSHADAIDQPRIEEASRIAQLHDFVRSLPAGYSTQIGERGIRLSGGQRQRLGIARAIYKQAPVLVLDEATSALDVETERAVINALERLHDEGRTIIVIAHRASTIAGCSRVVKLEGGRIVDM